jgi:iron complex transport system ATP-binding protein
VSEVLRTEAASFAIGGRLVVDGVDITVAPGTVTALIGPNGAGKSSLIRVLAAIERPSDGRVLLGDTDWNEIPRRNRARIAALVEQDSTTETAITVSSVVALGRTPYASLLSATTAADRAAVAAAMATAGVRDFAKRDYSTLSGGERQRVQLARALAQEPRILLLDEPTNHLDVRAQLEVLGTLRELAGKGIGVLTALHDLNLAASYADQVVVLLHGRVVAAGSPSVVLTARMIEEVYGVTATVISHPVTDSPLIAFSARPKGAASPTEPPTPA